VDHPGDRRNLSGCHPITWRVLATVLFADPMEAIMEKRAVILYRGFEFMASANCAQKFLRERGFRTVRLNPFREPPTLANLPRFPQADFMVWYSHGGWDGPLVFENPASPVPGQISPDEAGEWARLVGYFKMQLKPGGVFIAHSCHAAGSDWRERREFPTDSRVWVRSVAKDMNVYAAGQAGMAGAANLTSVRALLEFALTGRNSGGYPFRAYAPGGARITPPSRWPATARASSLAP
jgi:hypothetical protein